MTARLIVRRIRRDDPAQIPGQEELPSGRFSANDAWLTCAAITHNLTHGPGHLAAGSYGSSRPATIRTRIINVAARLAHRGRTIHLHLPEQWPWQAAFDNLFTAVQTTPG